MYQCKTISSLLALLCNSQVSALVLTLGPVLRATNADTAFAPSKTKLDVPSSSSLFNVSLGFPASQNSAVPLSTPSNFHIDYDCNHAVEDLPADSCEDAIRHVAFVSRGRAFDQVTWGDRDEGTFDVMMPQSAISCKLF